MRRGATIEKFKSRLRTRGARLAMPYARLVKLRGARETRLARELTGLAAVIANCRGVFAAESGGNGVDPEAAIARKLFGICDLRERRKHQQFAVSASIEVGTAGFEVWAEAARNDCDQGKPGFANGAGDGLLSWRDATRNYYAAAIAEEKGVFGFGGDFAGSGAARDLDEQFVWNFSEKCIADGIAGGGDGGGDRRAGRGWQNPNGRGWQDSNGRCLQDFSWRSDDGSGRALSERAVDQPMKVDRAGNLEEIVVLHNGPTALGIAQDIAGHAFQLVFAEENRVVKPGKPECRRAVDRNWRFKREVSLCACDLEASDDFAEWCAKPFVNPDDAMEVFWHDGVLAGLDFGEDEAKLFPGLGDGGAERRWNELAVYDFAENWAATFHDQRNQVKPRFTIIPTRQSYAGLEVAVFVAFAIHCRFSFRFCAQGAQGPTPGCARQALGVRAFGILT